MTGTEVEFTEIEGRFFDTVRALPHLAYTVGYRVEPGTAYKSTEGSLTAFVQNGDPKPGPVRVKRPAASRASAKRRAPGKPRQPKAPAAAVAEPPAPVEVPADAPAFGGELEPAREKNLEVFLEATGGLDAIPDDDLGDDAA